MSQTPFDSVESAQHYLMLLIEEAARSRTEIQQDIRAADTRGDARQLEALRLVDHKLNQLGVHLHAAARVLNDLRMLRRVLVGQAPEDDAEDSEIDPRS